MKELVDELERLAERFWSADKAEAASIMRTADVLALLERVNRDAIAAHSAEEIDELVALEADRAEKARRLAVNGGSAAQGVDGNVADGDAAELAAQGAALFERYQTILLRRVFALEFCKAALGFFEPSFEDGIVGFKCRDLLAAKKRTEALKWLAARIEELCRGDCSLNVHDVIIAYFTQAA